MSKAVPLKVTPIQNSVYKDEFKRIKATTKPPDTQSEVLDSAGDR